MILPRLLGVFALALSAGERASQEDGRITDSILQIGVLRQAGAVNLEPVGSFSVIDQTTGEVRKLVSGRSYRLESDDGKRVILGQFLFLGPTRLLPESPGDYVMLGSHKYHGNLVFKPGEAGTLTVVDEVGIEEYLRGVLPREMSPDWPIEALKAQAVVARTYALLNLGKYTKEGYDLSDDTRSQVYSGMDVESPRIRQAVADTRGEVLTYQGKLIPGFFHACCGGQTTDPASVWGMSEPAPKPLRGVGCRYCKKSPYYAWQAYFAKDDILKELVQHGKMGTRLKYLRPGERAPAGFLKNLKFKLDGTAFALRADQFRKWMGTREMRSTQIWRVLEKKNGYEFVGKGYGHGVGMCQWGARGQAEKGRDYRKILAYYFPGAKIVKKEQ